MDTIEVGDKVSHPAYGKGVVFEKRSSMVVRVRFGDSKCYMHINDLKKIDSDPTAPKEASVTVLTDESTLGHRSSFQFKMKRSDYIKTEGEAASQKIVSKETIKHVKIHELDVLSRKKCVRSRKSVPAPIIETKEMETIDIEVATIEALKLGLVFRDGIEKYSVEKNGDSEFVNNILKKMNVDGGHTVAIIGENGDGKSHVLTMIEKRFIEENYVVMKATFDETEPYYPKRVYRVLANHIFIKDNMHGVRLRDILIRIFAEAEKTPRLRGEIRLSNYFSPVYQYYIDNDGIVEDDIWRYIEGEDIESIAAFREKYEQHFMFFPNWKTRPQICCNLLNCLAHYVQYIGYKGLVIEIDEAELIQETDYDVKNLRFATDFVRSIHYLAMGPNSGIGMPDLPNPTQISWLSKTPYRLFSDAIILFAFGFTSGIYNAFYEKALSNYDKLEISSFKENDLRNLIHNLNDLYSEAYCVDRIKNLHLEKIIEKSLELHDYYQTKIRVLIQAFLTICDYNRLYPNENLTVTIEDFYEQIS